MSITNQEPTSGEKLLLQLLIKNTESIDRILKIMEQQTIYTNLLLFPNNDLRVKQQDQQQQQNSTIKPNLNPNSEHQKGVEEPNPTTEITDSKSIS